MIGGRFWMRWFATLAAAAYLAPLAAWAEVGEADKAPAVEAPTGEELWREASEIADLFNKRYDRDVEAAKLRLAKISDPRAGVSLIRAVRETKDKRYGLLMLEAAARCGGERVAKELASQSIRALWAPELRDEAAQLLAKMDEKDKLAALPSIAHGLRSESSVFRALQVLEMTGLDAPPAKGEPLDGALVLGLIGALKIKATAVQVDPFGRRANAPVPQANPLAHKALQKYTGEALPLDQAAWLSWFGSLPAERKRMPPAPLRTVAPIPDKKAEEGTYEVHTPDEWRTRLLELRHDLEDRDDEVHQAAIDAIVNIHDADALIPLKHMISHEVYIDYRGYWTIALGNVAGEESLETLINLAVHDELGVMWEACAGLERMEHREKALPMMVKHLADRKHQVQAVQVLAAAKLVQRPKEGEPLDLDVVRWLIDALAIKSKVYFKQPFYYCFDTVTLATGSTSGFSHGVTSGMVGVPVPVVIRTPNDLAHRLLQQYTGQDLPLDQRVWTRWYLEQRRRGNDAGR